MFRRTATNGSADYGDRVPMTKILTPMRTKNLIPAKTGFLIQRQLANPNQCLISTFPNQNRVQQLVGCYLELEMAKLAYPEEITRRWWGSKSSEGFIETYTQQEITTITIEKESKFYKLTLGDSSNALPQRIHWVFMEEDALTGHYRTNNFKLVMPKILNIRLKNTSGETYLERHTYTHTTDEEDYSDLYRTFREQQDPKEFTQNSNNIPQRMWSHGGYCIFTWDLSRGHTSNLDGIISEPRYGPFIAEFDFRKKLPANLNLVIMQEFPRSWSVEEGYKVRFK